MKDALADIALLGCILLMITGIFLGFFALARKDSVVEQGVVEELRATAEAVNQEDWFGE